MKVDAEAGCFAEFAVFVVDTKLSIDVGDDAGLSGIKLISVSGVEHDLEGVNVRQFLLTPTESFTFRFQLLIQISGFIDSSHALM